MDTHNYAEFSGVGSLKPDLLLYDKENVKTCRVGEDAYRSHFGFAELFIEVKKDKSRDPFKDPASIDEETPHKFISEYKGKQKKESTTETIGQIVSYATELCARQHRTHCFSISIYGPIARLIRWDRSGAIVSRAFNYHEEPWLRMFAQRFNRATNAERGYNMTIGRAQPEEESRFVENITEHIRKQLDPDDEDLPGLLDVHYEVNKVYLVPLHPEKVQRKEIFATENLTQSSRHELTAVTEKFVSDPIEAGSEADKTDTEDLGVSHSKSCKYTEVQYFLVSRPISAPLSLAGRCTRGYWAVKIPDKSIGEVDYKLAFLKDTWRISAAGVEKEGEVYLELLDAGVPFISEILCHGDVTQSEASDNPNVTGPGSSEHKMLNHATLY